MFPNQNVKFNMRNIQLRGPVYAGTTWYCVLCQWLGSGSIFAEVTYVYEVKCDTIRKDHISLLECPTKMESPMGSE